MERRTVFPGRLFPALLLLPQLAVTFVFFFWPAGQALLESVRREDAFGLRTRFVGLDNFAAVFASPDYLASLATSFLFSFAVAVLALAAGLLFAAMADRVVRGAAFYKTVLVLPYAVAPAIAGVLWLFLFHPSFGIVGSVLRRAGVDWNYLLNGRQALLLVIL
ncbi:MAG TPA: glycerol-3-phosphate transporter permease, partial [Stellaceae bacterium]|nr:glycerol-3-phosphate transporter permease [Stellaceae bacterium]